MKAFVLEACCSQSYKTTVAKGTACQKEKQVLIRWGQRIERFLFTTVEKYIYTSKILSAQRGSPRLMIPVVLVTSQGNSNLTCGTGGAACAAARTVGPRDKAVQSQGDHEGL